MDKMIKNKDVRDYLTITFAIFVLALGINVFYAPVNLVTGGVSGLGIIFETAIGAPLWLTNALVNIPLFAISIKQRGFAFGKRSLFATTMLSLMLFVTEFIPDIMGGEPDLLLASVFGGLLVGTGLGLTIKSSGTTGGTDMLASIIKYKYNDAPMAQLMMMIDICIIGAGFFMFGAIKAMYAIISVYIISKVISAILDGIKFGKGVYIISDKYEEIADAIINNVKRGVTGINAEGMYTREDKKVLYVVVPKKEIMKLRNEVMAIDNKAFMTITDVREVFGEGFIEDTSGLS